MKTRSQRVRAIVLGVVIGLALPGAAQIPFDSGSDGTYGDIDVTINTVLDMADAVGLVDGVYHCTSVNIAMGATLTLDRNEDNTPVTILASGAVVIDGAIDISWIRENFPPNVRASASTVSVLPIPGTPSSNTWPAAKNAATICRIISC